MMVSLQMTTSLRPILGRSDHFITQEKKFFLEHWGDTAGTSLKSTAEAAPKPKVQEFPVHRD